MDKNKLFCCFYGYAKFPENEQHKTMDSHKSVQQLILERDQAMADLNSVERSLSDLFRRYENMKKVLEGFKKVSGTKHWDIIYWMRARNHIGTAEQAKALV